MHSYKETLKQAATCTITGLRLFVCECGDSYTEVIPATGHGGQPIVRYQKEPTCTEDGYTGDIYCGQCLDLLRMGETIPARGHQWDEGIVTHAATCLQETCSSRR